MGASGDFSIGSSIWPGTSKAIEEMGELQQVLGKLIATAGDTDHWSGDLRLMLVDEAADVLAAVYFFSTMNFSSEELGRMNERVEEKVARFHEWQKNPTKP